MRILSILFLFGLSSVAHAADCPSGGRLLIKTQPEGAEVWLDGQKLGLAPVVTPPLCPSKHELRVQAEGFVPQTVAAIAPPNGSLATQTVALALAASIRDPKTGMEFALIPKGCFQMGSPAGEAERSDTEGPQHRVCIDEPFYLGKTEVTQAQWEAVMGSNPSYFKGANLPVEWVSWNDIQTFIRPLA